MEAGNEEAIRGLSGALEAEPEMGILVLEMVNGGGGGVAFRPGLGRQGGMRGASQKDVGAASSRGALGQRVHSQSQAWGPTEATPPWQRAIPQDSCGN